MISVSFHNVYKRFDVQLLDGVSWNIPSGSVWGLIGPAASGKSTLLKLVCGLVAADQGSITVDNIELLNASSESLRSIRRNIGMLFQNNALFDFMSVIDNVAFPLLRLGTDRDEALSRAEQRLRSVGLSGSEQKFPSDLSGGMKKRAAIARASIADPPLLIYDEPTAGLDPVTTSKIYQLLHEDQSRVGSTMIIVSSDVAGLLSFVPKVAMLYDGRIRFQGSSNEASQTSDAIVRNFVHGILDE